MFCITGDTHSPIDVRKLGSGWEQGKKLTKNDFLIVTGDFGFFWDNSASEIWWRKWLDEKPWTTLFVDGNHENFDVLESYPTTNMFGGVVSVLTPSIIWLRRGEVYEIDGLKIFTFGGATSRDKEVRTPGKSWWFQECPTWKDFLNAEKNLDKHNWEVDIVVSHTCPHDEMKNFLPEPFLTEYRADTTVLMLQEIKDKLKFNNWFFGHLHVNNTKDSFVALYNDIVQVGKYELEVVK